MFTRNHIDRFAARVLSGLVVTVVVVMASLADAVSHIQVVACHVAAARQIVRSRRRTPHANASCLMQLWSTHRSGRG